MSCNICLFSASESHTRDFRLRGPGATDDTMDLYQGAGWVTKDTMVVYRGGGGQPRSQGFSLFRGGGPTKKGKALGTRLEGRGYRSDHVSLSGEGGAT